MAVATGLLLSLQAFHVLFLLLHDWVPLGTLNNVPAVRASNPGAKLWTTTAVSSLPFIFDLGCSVYYVGRAYPGWLFWWLWISYGLLFAGELRAWWVPYLFGAGPARTERYATMFANTNSFLPVRHGIRVNTLHVVLHVATVMTLITLAIITPR